MRALEFGLLITCLTLLVVPSALAAEDRLGDALPEAALQRLGTLRLRGGIGDLCYLLDGRSVIAAGNSINIWDLSKGELQATHKVCSASITGIEPRSDGKALLVADSSGKVHEWNLADNEVLHSFATDQSGLRSAHYSPDSTRVLTTGATPPTIKEFELATAKELASITGNMHSFREAIYGPEGKTALVNGAAGSGPILAHYDLTTGELIHEWHKDYYAHTRSIVLSADGERVLAGTRHSATEWQVADHTLLQKFSGHHGHAVTAVAYCKDPDQLLTGSRDGSIRRWNRLENQVLLRWCPHNSHVTHIQVSPDGERALSYGSGIVAETSLIDGKSTLTWQRHNGPVAAVALLPSANTAISGSTDATLRTWNYDSGECLSTIEGATLGAYAVAVSPDGKRVAAGCKDGIAREFSLPDGELIRDLKGHFGYILAVAYTPDGQHLLSSAGDGSVRVWDMEKAEPVHILKQHLGGVLAIAVSADGKFVLSGGRDGTVRLWDLPGAKLLKTLTGHRGWVNAVAFAGDSRHGLSSGRDGKIFKWNLESGEVISKMTHGGWVRALVCSPDGKIACAGGDDNLVTCWDLSTDEKTATLKGHQGRVNALALAADGKRLISASQDTTLLVWELP